MGRYSDANVTVMGIGLHGGGRETIRYLLGHGARITATDMQGPEVFSDLLEEFAEAERAGTIRFVLGRHERDDFTGADLVIKNPAVPRGAPLLMEAPRLSTDIALFLEARKALNHTGPLIAVTGTKGKSTTASACAHILRRAFPETRLGGNITVSPLSFVDETVSSAPVVLELSSFQLGDLELCGADPVAPDVSIISNILHDHQNYYSSMDAYVHDKTLVFSGQYPNGRAIFFNDIWGRRFAEQASVPVWLCDENADVTAADPVTGQIPGDRTLPPPVNVLLPDSLPLPGIHNRRNFMMAALAAYTVGVSVETIREAVADFPGVPHRMEVVGRAEGVTCINDSAATIPDAVLATVRALEAPVVLIAGGTDKKIDFSPIPAIAKSVESLYLLEGSATERIIALLEENDLPYQGPYGSLDEATAGAWNTARELSRRYDHATLALSPGAASFGMFTNEFERGNRFRILCRRYLEG